MKCTDSGIFFFGKHRVAKKTGIFGYLNGALYGCIIVLTSTFYIRLIDVKSVVRACRHACVCVWSLVHNGIKKAVQMSPTQWTLHRHYPALFASLSLMWIITCLSSLWASCQFPSTLLSLHSDPTQLFNIMQVSPILTYRLCAKVQTTSYKFAYRPPVFWYYIWNQHISILELWYIHMKTRRLGNGEGVVIWVGGVIHHILRNVVIPRWLLT